MLRDVKNWSSRTDASGLASARCPLALSCCERYDAAASLSHAAGKCSRPVSYALRSDLSRADAILRCKSCES